MQLKFVDFLNESSKNVDSRKIIVVYGGGFQPFHAGHLSSYLQAKKAFPQSNFFVAASNDIKTRPIPFKDKKFLAQQAGVVDDFVQVKSPLNPTEILTGFDPKKDILILVRSERDPMSYTKKSGEAAYYQPFKDLKDSEPFEKHAYVFVTKKHNFFVAGKEVFSGSQIREMYSKANNAQKNTILQALYPKSNNVQKIKQLLDKYIASQIKEEFLFEGVNDKSIFKVVFLAGGPGSGKDFVLSKTLDGHGLTEINSDNAFEYLMDKYDLDKKMPDSEEQQRNAIRAKAKTTTDLKQRLAIQGRNGLIINGTGEDAKKIASMKIKLEALGYETKMLVVNTSNEVSKQRNVERGERGGRTVPEDIRAEK
jgi:phosphopantetheine adenylyltransferase